MDFDEVEDELANMGIKTPGTLNQMEVQLMLVEMRLRTEGATGLLKQLGQKFDVPSLSPSYLFRAGRLY